MISRAAVKYLILAAGLLLSFPHDVFAGSNLDCIADAKGRKVSWNSLWEKDRADNNVEYRITGITQFDKIPLRRITLELKAVDSATISNRTVIITTEDKARAMCDSLVTDKDRLRFPGMETTSLDLLPFIRFTKDGWVRDDLQSQIELGVCMVGTQKFSCPESDRQRFGATLRNLEEELRAQVP